jgi:ribosomal protein L12E/L44/L45/RPP1/RPP2
MCSVILFTALHCSGDELHERIPALMNAIGVDFDDEVLTEMIETVVTMGDV